MLPTVNSMDVKWKTMIINEGIDFQSQKIINKGASSSVYEFNINHQPTVCRSDRKVAVKISEYHDDLKKEASILSGLSHRHVVILLSILTNQEEGKEVIYGIVLEYLDGPDLYEMVNSKGCPGEKQVINYAKCILSALRYLGQSKVTHGDVNLYNMVLTSAGREVKLVDFGCASIFDSGDDDDDDDRFRNSTIFDLTYFGSSMLELLTGQTFESCLDRRRTCWSNQSSLTPHEVKQIDDLFKPDFKDPKLSPSARDFFQRLVRLKDDCGGYKRAAAADHSGRQKSEKAFIDDVYETFIGHKFLKISTL